MLMLQPSPGAWLPAHSASHIYVCIYCFLVIMAALRSRCKHYLFIMWFLSSIYLLSTLYLLFLA